ncbi:acyl-CoA dehydrogenase family protein [Rhodobacter sp. 24-YEA-8]|uniref:acyl-CoA dehydrogenase family protein n=1 Tax=Rhodobacter sp. 24-YEA-8 TaxID=1884310 RepID=UPI00089AC55A|nr:acyl-CoA dehydrogenase family protein [Rhodobacter sp. 24-YEA-8]SED88054.1 Acyl-CoA dehydrogenase, C-terminal domain [Rhodobacter sp. 24-YEA-8]
MLDRSQSHAGVAAADTAAAELLLAGWSADDFDSFRDADREVGRDPNPRHALPPLASTLMPAEAAQQVLRLAVLDLSAGRDAAHRWQGARAWTILFDQPALGPTVLAGPQVSLQPGRSGVWRVTDSLRPAPLIEPPARVIVLGRDPAGQFAAPRLAAGFTPDTGFQLDPQAFGERRLLPGRIVVADQAALAVRALWPESPTLEGFAAAQVALARLLSLAVALGGLKAALWKAHSHIRLRASRWYDAWPGPVREDPLVLREFGRWWVGLRAADELFSNLVAGLSDDAALRAATPVLTLAETHVARLGSRLFNEVFELTGASAMRRDRELDRHWRGWAARPAQPAWIWSAEE